jgi:nitrous oxide reductase accessory protein NosL
MLKIIISLIVSVSLSFSTNILPVKAKFQYKMDYSKDTICLVRHFKIYKDPKWVAKIELKNGKKVFFSSPKSMFEFYHRPGKWYEVGVKNEKDFKDIIVTDYETMELINAKDAYYIYGSRATSPGGDDLVVIGNKTRAENFAKKYSGKRVFRFNEVSDPLIRLINGRT